MFKDTKIIFFLIAAIFAQSLMIPFYSYAIKETWETGCDFHKGDKPKEWSSHSYPTKPRSSFMQTFRSRQKSSEKQKVERTLSKLSTYEIDRQRPYEFESMQLLEKLRNVREENLEKVIQESKNYIQKIRRELPSKRSYENDDEEDEEPKSSKLGTAFKWIGGALGIYLAIWAGKKIRDTYRKYRPVATVASSVADTMQNGSEEDKQKVVEQAAEGTVRGVASLLQDQQNQFIETASSHIQLKLTEQENVMSENLISTAVKGALTGFLELGEDERNRLIETLTPKLRELSSEEQRNPERFVPILKDEFLKLSSEQQGKLVELIFEKLDIEVTDDQKEIITNLLPGITWAKEVYDGAKRAQEIAPITTAALAGTAAVSSKLISVACNATSKVCDKVGDVCFGKEEDQSQANAQPESIPACTKPCCSKESAQEAGWIERLKANTRYASEWLGFVSPTHQELMPAEQQKEAAQEKENDAEDDRSEGDENNQDETNTKKEEDSDDEDYSEFKDCNTDEEDFKEYESEDEFVECNSGEDIDWKLKTD